VLPHPKINEAAGARGPLHIDTIDSGHRGTTAQMTEQLAEACLLPLGIDLNGPSTGEVPCVAFQRQCPSAPNHEQAEVDALDPAMHSSR
jgi:hypothetical protein